MFHPLSTVLLPIQAFGTKYRDWKAMQAVTFPGSETDVTAKRNQNESEKV